MPVPVALLTPSTIPRNSAPEAVLDEPLSREMKFSELWEDKQGMTFSDFLDIINPLQHIPIVSTIYRAVTGDEIGLGARILGGGLFGGPAGIIAAGVQAAVEEATGKDLGANIMAFLQDVSGFADDAAQLAETDAKVAGLAEIAPAAGDPAAAAPAVTASGGAGVARVALASGAGLSMDDASNAEDYFGFASIYPAAGGAPAIATPPKDQASRQPVPASPLAQTPGKAPQIAKQRAQPASFPALSQRTGPMDAQSQRIMESIAQAQRAQAGILMASLSIDRPQEKPGTDERSADSDDKPRDPVRGQPNAAPVALAPQWMGRAMAPGVGQYQRALGLQPQPFGAPTARP